MATELEWLPCKFSLPFNSGLDAVEFGAATVESVLADPKERVIVEEVDVPGSSVLSCPTSGEGKPASCHPG